MAFLSDSVRASGQLGTGFGISIVILGIICLIAPFVTGLATTAMLSVLILAAGITTLAYVFNAKSFGAGALQFVSGALITALGSYMLANPTESLGAFTIAVIAYLLIDGILTVVTSFKLKPISGWGWTLASGLSSLLLGGLLWYQWPLSGAFAIGILVGVRLIFAGWSYVMLGAVTNQVGNEIEKEIEKEIDNETEKAIGV
ncbi:DUF308 domain-containing protein [Thalassotalea sp. LPB0316]|uniref:HdeD family acid-resistance protein n=1 Tax=Thalassotalea sp. LPB0316 TaxID=2769490 RepID=UPI001866F687|nr:DUF308 domain-containing protein [Thalassotalea sp. LPB0316]QOL27179.1 DUF308 domain-containing protein [Thalassotalea sp. LPB0316]